MNLKSLTMAVRKGAGTPTEQQLLIINGMALAELKAEDVYVRTFIVGHNGIDRDGEVFDEALLDDFARTIKGKGVFIRHPSGWDGDSGPGEGRVFDAFCETKSFEDARRELGYTDLQFPPDRTQAKLLYASSFMVKVPENASLRSKIDAGIAGDVSIGFSAAGRTAIAGRDGGTLAYRWNAPGEALEKSIVWLGAQQGARAVKSTPRTPEAPDMDPKDQLVAAQKSATEANDALKVAQPKAAGFDAIKAALGTDDAALADSPAALAKLVKAGKAHRKSLVDAIVTSERHLKIVGDKPEDETKARAQYDELSTEALEGFKTRYDAQTPKGSNMKQGDPNAGVGSHDKPTSGPLANPLIAGAAAVNA